MSNSSSRRDDLNQCPETVSFTGVGRASLKQIHAIALALVALGVVFAVLSPPGGYVLLAFFILIAASYDMVFIRRSQKPVRVTLNLHTDPVEASMADGRKIGEIRTGAIETDMDAPNELGYRPAPGKDLLIWEFDTPEDARVVSRRLLEYLPRDRAPG